MPREPDEPERRTTDNPPPQTWMGLLDYVTAHAVDEDYAHVSRKDSSDSSGGPGPARPGVAALIILGLFGLLAATAAVQTSRNAVAAESGREGLVTQIQSRSAKVDAVRERIVDVRKEVERLETQYLDATAEGRAVSGRLDRLGTNTGSLAATGPGVKIVVDDAPNATSSQQEVLDQDLQKLVNALWESGAEAISINGQRLTNLSAIRQAGSAITVNYRSLARPYVVSAIGDPNSIPARFVETEHGGEWLDLKATFGLQFDLTMEDSLSLPAATRLDLRFATSTEDSR